MAYDVEEREPLIFLIFGASGSGKSTLFHELETMEPWVTIHSKGTDRKRRQYDGKELICKDDITLDEYDYIYRQYGHKYGIQKRQIDAALQQGKHHFIICNDIETIQDIKRDYGEHVRVIFLLFDAPKDTILAIQKTRQISDDEVDLRVQKISVLNQIFVDHSELFDAVVINKFGASSRKMLTQIRRIIAAEERPQVLYKEGELRTELVGIAETVLQIRRNLQQHAEEIGGVVQDDYLFILMAMRENDPLLEDAHAAIKRAATALGLRAQRVDEIAFTEQITNKILGSIRCAEYVVADLTHERPNVYYELGYAHAFGKKTILTARKQTELHFDVQNYPVIFYSASMELERQLKEILSRFEQEKKSAP